MDTHTHAHSVCTEAILRNQVHVWFNTHKHKHTYRHLQTEAILRNQARTDHRPARARSSFARLTGWPEIMYESLPSSMVINFTCTLYHLPVTRVLENMCVFCALAFQILMWFSFNLGVSSINMARCENLPQFVKLLQEAIDNKCCYGSTCIVSKINVPCYWCLYMACIYTCRLQEFITYYDLLYRNDRGEPYVHLVKTTMSSIIMQELMCMLIEL